MTLHFASEMDRMDTLIPITRRKFSSEEDQALQLLVIRYGREDWNRIACLMPGRDSRQCKERWSHYLSPNIVQARWTKFEDELLEQQVAQHGHRWKMFEALFPGRVDISIKNRYNVLFRQKRRQIRAAMKQRTKNMMRNQGLNQADASIESNISDGFNLWDDNDDFEWVSFFDQ
jgi:hypothetical protein